MSRYSFKTVASDITNWTNAQFLKGVSDLAPQFKEIASRVAAEGFTEGNFEAMSQLPSATDAVTDFYKAACMVGLQFVDYAGFRNKVDELGIVEKLSMPLGRYLQRNRIGRIKNTSPAWKGLKNGDSPDQFKVRKPELITDWYSGVEVNWQNFITIEDFGDLKQAWLREYGIGETVGAIFNMIDLDRAEFDYTYVKEAFHTAITSTEHPLQGSQKLLLDRPDEHLDNFTGDTMTQKELDSFIKLLSNVYEQLDACVSTTAFNAAKYPMMPKKSDLVLYVRPGYKIMLEKLLVKNTFNKGDEKVPARMEVVENFGGLVPYDSDNVELQPVYDNLGAMVGYVKSTYTNVSTATYDERADKYTVRYGAQQGSTADVTPESEVDHYVDPLESTFAVLAEKGTVFMLMQNPLKVTNAYNALALYGNTIFSQPQNYLGVNYTKFMCTFTRQQAE